MAQTGRPPSCTCGDCRRCRHNRVARERYQQKTLEERRAARLSKDQDKRRANDRKRWATNPDRRVKSAAYIRDWRERNPQKVAAWRAVRAAVERGDLVPEPCEGCGVTENVHAHHDDYSKPLEVRWLCVLHHGATRTLEARDEAA